MELKDRTLTCKDCGAEFDFTVGEQEFYQQKGFENDPSRCKKCRSDKKRGGQKNGDRVYTEVECAGCGVKTQVPFKPKGDKPVYCKDCFTKR